MTPPNPSSKAKSKGKNALQQSHSNDESASQPVCRPDGEDDAPKHDLRQDTPNRHLSQDKTLSKQKGDESKEEKTPEPCIQQRAKKNSNANRSKGPRKPPELPSSAPESSENSHHPVSSGQPSPRTTNLKPPSRSRARKTPQKPLPDNNKVGHVMWPMFWRDNPHPLFLKKLDPVRNAYEACELKTHRGKGPRKSKNKYLTAEGQKNRRPNAELRFVDENNETTRLPKFSYLDCRRTVYIKPEELRHMNEGIFIMIPEDRLKVENKLKEIHGR